MKVNGNLLRAKMAAQGYSYKTLSKKSKESGYSLTDTALSSIITGRNKPSHSTMVALYKVLGLTPEEVIEIFFAEESATQKGD